MAEIIGQTQSFVSKCERGERRIDIVELRVFYKAMGIPIAKFVEKLEEAIEAES